MRALARSLVMASAILALAPSVASADNGPTRRGPWNTTGGPILCIEGWHMELHPQHDWTRCARD